MIEKSNRFGFQDMKSVTDHWIGFDQLTECTVPKASEVIDGVIGCKKPIIIFFDFGIAATISPRIKAQKDRFRSIENVLIETVYELPREEQRTVVESSRSPRIFEQRLTARVVAV